MDFRNTPLPIIRCWACSFCLQVIIISFLLPPLLWHLSVGSLAYLTAATHGLTEECEEIKETFGLDPETVSEYWKWASWSSLIGTKLPELCCCYIDGLQFPCDFSSFNCFFFPFNINFFLNKLIIGFFFLFSCLLLTQVPNFYIHHYQSYRMKATGLYSLLLRPSLKGLWLPKVS